MPVSCADFFPVDFWNDNDIKLPLTIENVQITSLKPDSYFGKKWIIFANQLVVWP